MKLPAYCLPVFLISLTGLAQTNSWQQTDFPQQYAGWVKAFHVSTNGSIFAGTNEDGLMRSTNDGKNWEQVRQGGLGESVDIIATTSSGEVFTIHYSQLFRSTDNGTSWSPFGRPEWMYNVLGLVINSEDHIFVGLLSGGVYRSTDLGDSWTALRGGLPNQDIIFSLAISPAGPVQVLYVISGGGPYRFYRSTDNGDSWTLCQPTIQVPMIFVHSDGDVYIDGNPGMLRSTDNGISWQTLSTDLGISVMLSMPNGVIWYASGSTILRSGTYGFTWTVVYTLNTSPVYAMARSQNGSVFVGTYSSGVFKTTDDGSTWQPANNGFANVTTQVITITGRHGGVLFAGTPRLGSFSSTNSGANWTRSHSGIEDIRRLAAHPSGPVFCANGNLWISNDAGSHWELLRSSGTSFYAYDVAVDGDGILYSCGVSSGVQRSTDIGATWARLPGPGYSIQRMHVTQKGTIVVLAPATDRRYFSTSTNGGSTWIASAQSSAPMSIYDFCSTSNGYLFAASQIGVYRSTDSGLNWYPTNNGFTTSDIRSLATDSYDVVYAGTNTRGVFRSTDYGYSWEPFNTGLTDTTITSLYCSADGYLYAGGWNRGIFKKRVRPSFPDARLGLLQPSIVIRTLFGHPKDSTIMIINDGLQPLTISNVTVSDSRFSIIENPMTLAPLATGTISIRFDSSVPDTTHASLVMYSNSTTSPDTISLRGEAIPAAVMVLSKETINFGALLSGRSRTDTVTILNSGTAVLIIKSVRNSWPYFIASQFPNVAPQDSAAITVTFTAPNGYGGLLLDDVYIFSNSITSPDHIALMGYYEPESNLTLSANNIDFGMVTIGEHRDTALTVSNMDDVYHDIIRDFPNSDPSFSFGFDPRSFVNAGSSIHDTIRFTPTSQGNRSITAIYRVMRDYLVSGADTVHIYGAGIAPVPDQFSLSQNYPNPFNGATKIEFQIAAKTVTVLKIFDLLGRGVTTLVNEEMNPGNYGRSFDGSGLASGVYFFRLQAGNFVQTRKLLLAR